MDNIFTQLEKLKNEGLIIEDETGALTFTAGLSRVENEVVAFGGGAVYEECFVEFERSGKKRAFQLNLADVLGDFMYQKVRIRVEPLEDIP